MVKKLILYSFIFFIALSAKGQYFLRGEIRSDKKQILRNTRVFVHSTKGNYYSDHYGSFGIPILAKYDSITFSMEDYEPKTLFVKTDVFQNVILKAVPADKKVNKQVLVSSVKDFIKLQKYSWNPGSETYIKLAENDFVNAAAFPNTGFSLNVNKSGYSNVRRFINWESTVPIDAVRAEELINYFNLRYKQPDSKEVFSTESQLISCPWNKEEQLLFLNVSAKKLDFAKAPPGNFVFLVDVSGSMDKPNRLPLLKEAFKLFVKNLRPQDRVSIVRYGGTVSIWLKGAFGSDKEQILKSFDDLVAKGDTPGASALRTAYKLAKESFIKNGTNRVILATDGDFNVGESSDKAMDELITAQKQSGIYLTCLGVGMGDFKDSKLQTLAKKGNGNYAYLDDVKEAEKVMVKELGQTLYTVADNAVMHVQFNPKYVKQYRLIGFDNKKEALADTTAYLEGGEVGSGSSTLAVFEIVPALPIGGLDAATEIAAIKIEYGVDGELSNKKMNFSVKNNYKNIDSADNDLRFASAVAMFALKIKQSKYSTNIEWNKISALAKSSADKKSTQQMEFVELVEKAKNIYEPKKKPFHWLRKIMWWKSDEE